MVDPFIRPPISAKLLKISAAFLESGLIVVFGVLLLAGIGDGPDSDSVKPPIRVGISVIPVLLVAIAYAIQRIWRPRRFAFVIAGALACALGAVFRAGLEPLQRLLDALRGFAVGAIVTGFLMTIDDEATVLLEGEVKPWREMFFGLLLVTFGAMPMAIYGGFVWAIATILLGIVVLVRCLRYDAPLVVPRKSIAALTRVFLSLLFLLLGIGFLVVCPMISLGMLRHR